MGRTNFVAGLRAARALRSVLGLVTVILGLGMATRALAEQTADAADWEKQVRASADPGRFLPGLVSADAGKALVSGAGWAGYDGATHDPVMAAMAEARLTRWLVLTVGVVYAPSNDIQPAALRPSVAARVHLLEQDRHGIDGGVAFAYRQDRFVGEDGFFQGAITVGRHGDAGMFVANVAYGTDGEGDDHEGEVRLVGMTPLGRRLNLGLDGKLRRSLGSTDPNRAAHGTPSLEFTAGPAATYAIGPIALVAEAGISGAKLMRFQTGVIALAGMGAVF